MMHIIVLNAVVFALLMFDNTLLEKLALFPSMVMQGQVWRLITYIFIPPTLLPIWLFFALYFYYMIGTALEQEWGSFKFNIYYFLGMLGTTAAAFLFGGFGTATFINLSLFFAFARLYPNYEILLFLIVPIKIKYLAWLNWAFFGFTIVFGHFSEKIAAVVAIINYFIFFARDIISNTKSYGRRKIYSLKTKDFTIHRCTVCGKTERDDPKMEFRYCSTCQGDYEYCMDHLKNHEHIKISTEAEN